MSKFLRFLLAVTAVTHVPFFFAVADVAGRVGAGGAVRWAAAAVVTGGLLASFMGRARSGMNDTPQPRWFTLLVEEPYYVHWSACIFTAIPSVLYLVVAPLVDLARGAPVTLHASFFTWVYGLGLLVCGYGVFVRRRWFVIEKLEVFLEDLPPALDGYRIAHLSDLHVGAMAPKSFALRWSRAANRLAPDLTVVTGDMVTNGTRFHADIAEVVGALRASDGVLVAMGNHDYFGEGEPLVGLLGAAGVRVLRNEGFVLRRGEGALYVSGIDDTWTRRADLTKALAARPAGMPTLLLAHDPAAFHDAAALGVDLVLSGHTHGGQIAVPFFARRLSPSNPAHGYSFGLYREGRATLYVHPGLGTTGPPIRLGVAPAVTELTLRRGASPR